MSNPLSFNWHAIIVYGTKNGEKYGASTDDYGAEARCTTRHTCHCYKVLIPMHDRNVKARLWLGLKVKIILHIHYRKLSLVPHRPQATVTQLQGPVTQRKKMRKIYHCKCYTLPLFTQKSILQQETCS